MSCYVESIDIKNILIRPITFLRLVVISSSFLATLQPHETKIEMNHLTRNIFLVR